MNSYGNTLDWTVTKYPTQINTPTPIQDENNIGLIRSDLEGQKSILGYVSPDYELVQNNRLFELIQPLIDSDIAYIANQGFLQYGKKVFLQLNLFEQFKIQGNNHSTFITLLNSHNGTSKLAIGAGNIRIICLNTFFAAQTQLSNKFSHRIGINDKLDIATVLDFISITNTQYQTNIDLLEKVILTDAKLHSVVKHVFGDNDKVFNNIVNLYRSGRGNNGKTAYDLFSATTDFVSHHQKKNEISAIINPIIGGGAKQSQKMLDSLLALV
jgi:Domain of unknown function (DUF932)